MKKSLLAMTVLAAMLFAGCTSSDEITTLESIKQAENAPTAIEFGTYVGRTGTRSGYHLNFNLFCNDNACFRIFAWSATLSTSLS